MMNNNSCQYSKCAIPFNKECTLDKQPEKISDLVVNCITEECQINKLGSYDTKFISDSFQMIEINPDIKREIIEKINNKNEKIREIISPTELDDIENLCSGNIRVRGPAIYLLHDSNESTKLVRITSGSPYIRLWKLE